MFVARTCSVPWKLHMEHAVFLTNDLPSSAADLHRAAVRRAIIFSVIILAITVGLCAGLYTYEKQTFHDLESRQESETSPHAQALRRDLLERVDRLALSVTAMAILGGLGSLVPLYVSATGSQRRLISVLERKVDE